MRFDGEEVNYVPESFSIFTVDQVLRFFAASWWFKHLGGFG
jgi:hypothetical protein